MFDWLPQNLHKQLEEAIQDGEIWVMQLKDTEYELEGSRERVQQQATEILHKASKTILALHSRFLQIPPRLGHLRTRRPSDFRAPSVRLHGALFALNTNHPAM